MTAARPFNLMAYVAEQVRLGLHAEGPSLQVCSNCREWVDGIYHRTLDCLTQRKSLCWDCWLAILPPDERARLTQARQAKEGASRAPLQRPTQRPGDRPRGLPSREGRALRDAERGRAALHADERDLVLQGGPHPPLPPQAELLRHPLDAAQRPQGVGGAAQAQGRRGVPAPRFKAPSFQDLTFDD